MSGTSYTEVEGGNINAIIHAMENGWLGQEYLKDIAATFGVGWIEIDQYAIDLLNPFTNEQELKNFSYSINQWDGYEFHLYHPLWIGEILQWSFILSFFKLFFPMAKFFYPKEEKERKRLDDIRGICIRMVDFNEFPTIQQIRNTTERAANEFSFSMVQAKILNSWIFNTGVIKKYGREKMATALKESPYIKDFPVDSIPIIVGSIVSDNDAYKSQPYDILKWLWPIRILSPFWNIIFIHGDTIYEEWVLQNLPETWAVKYLYAIGDFSLIFENKNKMEWVNANSLVITMSNEYLEKMRNPNYRLDKSLKERWWIYTLDEIKQQWGLSEVMKKKPTPLTDKGKKGIYHEYQNDPEKLRCDRNPREVVKEVLDYMRENY